MLNIDFVLQELRKFSPKIIEIGEAILDNRIGDFENKREIVLPSDFKELMTRCNGINLMGTEIYSFDTKSKKDTLESVYDYEHFDVKVPMFTYIVPFSPDGGGNFYCFDTRKNNNGSCSVIFWVSNYIYTETDMPEITHNSFLEWMQEILFDWILEDYDYEGNER